MEFTFREHWNEKFPQTHEKPDCSVAMVISSHQNPFKMCSFGQQQLVFEKIGFKTNQCQPLTSEGQPLRKPAPKCHQSATTLQEHSPVTLNIHQSQKSMLSNALIEMNHLLSPGRPFRQLILIVSNKVGHVVPLQILSGILIIF